MTKENNIIFDRETIKCFEEIRLSKNYIELDVWDAMQTIKVQKQNEVNIYRNLIMQKEDFIKNTKICPKLN